jgi:hypothetical protein
MGLFVHPDGNRSLEAYFGAVKLGPFEANLVAILDADDWAITRMVEDGVSDKPMPSGARRLELSASNTAAALALPVRELTYVPRARYDQEIALRRFGSRRSACAPRTASSTGSIRPGAWCSCSQGPAGT